MASAKAPDKQMFKMDRYIYSFALDNSSQRLKIIFGFSHFCYHSKFPILLYMYHFIYVPVKRKNNKSEETQ